MDFAEQAKLNLQVGIRQDAVTEIEKTANQILDQEAMAQAFKEFILGSKFSITDLYIVLDYVEENAGVFTVELLNAFISFFLTLTSFSSKALIASGQYRDYSQNLISVADVAAKYTRSEDLQKLLEDSLALAGNLV